MSDFIASNGAVVSHLDDGSLRFQTVTSIDKITAVNGLEKFWADAARVVDTRPEEGENA